MTDRDSTKHTLWWVSGDGQASMWGGNYESLEDAEAAIPGLEAEFRSQCNEEFPWDENSGWIVEPTADDRGTV